MKRFRSPENLNFKARSRSPSDRRASNFLADNSSRSRQTLQRWTELLSSSDSTGSSGHKPHSSPYLFLQFVMMPLVVDLLSGGTRIIRVESRSTVISDTRITRYLNPWVLTIQDKTAVRTVCIGTSPPESVAERFWPLQIGMPVPCRCPKRPFVLTCTIRESTSLITISVPADAQRTEYASTRSAFSFCLKVRQSLPRRLAARPKC